MLLINITGVVQGVGFRPFIYKLALEEKISGYVLNSSAGVEIKAEGEEKYLETFIERIKNELPPAASITEFIIKKCEDDNFQNFIIQKSRLNDEGLTFIPADLALCTDCLKELNDKKDFRYDYSFINCTNCGPRYSIIEALPYDRPETSMKNFPMCKTCDNEYKDPLNRRFHAQPVACHNCGPHLKLLNNKLKTIKGDPIEETIRLLKSGKVLGIKGIGGFHICIDGENKDAVKSLRQKKNRPHKPFAIMCQIENIKEIAEYNIEEEKILKSAAAPIVILKKSGNFLKNIAPENPNIGIFLPYAPLHYQLFQNGLKFLVMTSGNPPAEPIEKNEEKLTKICDYFLTHNRDIINKCDDSIVKFNKKEMQILRRARGYVPTRIKLPIDTIPTLGCGAELKLSFSLTKGDSLLMSPYFGNNGNKTTMDFYLETLARYKKWFNIEPELVACDLQPDFSTTKFAESLGLPIKRVQHHHAHMASVMAEHNINEQVIGVIYDGTGYGTDGNIWGGEILMGDFKEFERVYHLEYMPLPSGDSSIKNPVRLAYAYGLVSDCDMNYLSDITKLEKQIINKQIENNFNLFQTSSIGRLFDAVSAIIGLKSKISFEAEAAMALEFICSKDINLKEIYNYRIENGIIGVREIIKEIIKDLHSGVSKDFISRKFHNTIIDFTVNSVVKSAKKYGIKKIVLCGGVMLNGIILPELINILELKGFSVYTNRMLPPGDSSVSAGQTLVANSLREGV